MTDEIKEHVTEPIIEPSTTQPESINPAPKKSKKNCMDNRGGHFCWNLHMLDSLYSSIGKWHW
ncbi:MAG TPA: hypothetical protein DHW49_12080 [Anaerolineae bacterium]|nr:hypothetical protein [Anaerolineae bacterium]